MAEFLVHLAEFDRIRGWRELGYAGLFPFLERELGLSKSGAFFRMKAAQLIQEYPEILEPLRDGRLCLSTMSEVAKVLTPENRETVLPRFFHRSKQQARAVAAELAPVQDPPLRAVVTSSSRSAPGDGPRPVAPETLLQSVLPGEPTQSPCRAFDPLLRSAPPRDEIVPVTGDSNRLHFSASRSFVEKLEAAKMALSHVMPGAAMEQVLEAGLDLILAKDAMKKGLAAKPRPATDPRLLRFDTRYIPAEIRGEVWRRDQGKCQWRVADGRVCGSTFQLELDHIDGFQPGKPIAAKDLRVCCHLHNQEHARQVYGAAYMEQFRRPGRRRGSPRRLPGYGRRSASPGLIDTGSGPAATGPR